MLIPSQALRTFSPLIFRAFICASILLPPLLVIMVVARAQPNSPPTARNDSYTGLAARRQLSPGLLANDSDPDGDRLTVSGPAVQPAHGSVLLGSDGSFSYSPSGGFTGTDTFVYRVCDPSSACTTAMVSVDANDPPVAGDDFYVGLAARRQDNPGWLVNDSDPDGDPITVFSSLVRNPQHGYQDHWSGGGFSYGPAWGWTDADTLIYKVCDSFGACDEGTVTLDANDPPVGVSETYNVRGGMTVAAPGLLANDSDPDGDSIKVESVVTNPQHGYVERDTTGRFSFTPTAGYTGTDRFVYKLADYWGAYSLVTVNLNIVGDGESEGVASCNEIVGLPVNVTNGNMYMQQTDYRLPGVGTTFDIERTYNSLSLRTGLFGRGWTTAYDESITINDGNIPRLNMPDGRAIYFGRATGSTSAFSPLTSDFHAQLTRTADGFTLSLEDGGTHEFDAAGKLLALIDRAGNRTMLTYVSGRLSTVIDASGRVLNFATNASGRVLSIGDALGIVATYSYGANGEMLRVTYADGSLFNFTYYSTGYRWLPTSVTDALGNVVEAHSYNSNGRALTSEKHGGVEKYTLNYVSATRTDVTDALGHVTKYFFDKSKGRNAVTRVEGACSCGGAQTQTWTYDNGLNVTGKTNALAHTESYTYDANGNRLTQTDALGTSTYTYNSLGQVLSATDVMGGITTNTYDAQGNLLTTKDALDKTTSFTYDARGLMLTATDARANVTSLEYDASGNLTRKTDAAAGVTAFMYDARGQVVTETDALGKVTSYEYDAAGRVKKVTRPDATFVTFTYDIAGRRTRMTDGRGNSTDYAYDAAYRLTRETNAQGKTKTYTYNLMSKLTSMTDESGRTTNYEYDEFNRLVKTTYPAAVSGGTRLEERIEYDLAGNIKKRFDQAGGVTSYEYDAANRLTKTIDAALKETTYEYNARSEMTAVVDALGQRYTFTYDALGRVTGETRGGHTQTFAYDAVGNRTSRTDYNGAVSVYDYDALNRLTTATYPDATTATYAYDTLSRVTQAANASGAVTFGYDDLGRVSATTGVDGQAVSYGYDANGNRTGLTLGGVSQATYTHDALNRLTQITDAAGAAVTYGYDATNKRTTRTLPNGVTSAYSYDDLNRLTRLTDAKATTTVTDNQYAYNAVGNITQNTTPEGVKAYGYDAVDRLTSATRPTLPTETYAYDAVGNRTSSHQSANITYQPFNKLQSTATSAYSYDANGNLTQKTDATGTTLYLWDYENRLTHVTRPDGVRVNYKYDALGRRVERSPSTGQLTKFVYDGQDVVRDIHQDGTTTDYLNGLGIDEKLRQQGAAGVFYFTHDQLGSTTALTDAQGNVVERMTYDAFGNSPPSARTRYTFTGREYDELAGLYYYRARWYDAQAGRFISEDPIGFAGGINFYAYVENNPVNFVDPKGTNPLVYLAAGAASIGELLLHNYLFDRATNIFPQPQDPQGRKRHCYVNCMSTRIHLGNPIPGQIFSAGQEARNITNISGFNLQDTLGDIGANYYGSGAGYVIIYSCERLCEECQ